MESTNIHEVIISRNGLQVQSADAAFYAFMGERLYVPFEQFVIEEDKNIFRRNLLACSGERFMMRLLGEDGRERSYFSRIREGQSEDSLTVLLLYAEKLVETQKQLQKTVSIQNAFLKMYQDTYFEYEPGGGTIRLYTIDRSAQNVELLSLEEFEDRLMLYASETQKKEVRQFIMNIKTGVRRFEMRVDRNLLTGSGENCLMTVNATSIYDKGALTTVAGCIHLGKGSENDVQKKVEVDSLTGLITKEDITRIAIDLINVRKVKGITLAVADIDFFKKANDTYGHMCGDEVLRKAAGIIEKEVGESGMVGRIGGDEFLIIFYHAENMEYMRERLICIKNNIRASFPPGVEGRPAVTLSIGCAAYPKDADQYEDLFYLADFALYLAKEKGRDRYIIYDREKHGDPQEIRNRKKTDWMDSRGDLSMGEILCIMMDRVFSAEEYPLEKLLDDFTVNFGIQRIMIHAGSPYRITQTAGEQRPSAERIKDAGNYMNLDGYLQEFDTDGMLLLNHVKSLEGKLGAVCEQLEKLNIHSLIQIRFTDSNGTPAVLSLESLKGTTWNRTNLHYYRLLARMLSQYELL